MEGFVDETTIEVSSGHGGAGAVSFRREKFVPYGGPDGGDGGRGGDVIFLVKQNLRTLSHLRMRRLWGAGNGGPGLGERRHGKDGESIFIPVPPGTLVKNADSGLILHDFSHTDEGSWIFQQGGRGGQGNWHFRSSRHQVPRFSQPGEPGQNCRLTIELNIIADIGFVGFPNAGKSTLLSLLTNANPKIAPYPFTTKIPNLGVLHIHDRDIVLADIPGILEGASDGHGLGIQFLKHISRTKGLAFLIDLSEEGFQNAYETLVNELEVFSPELSAKPRLIIGSKTDLDENGSRLSELRKLFSEIEVFGVSSFARDRLDELREAFFRLAGPETDT